MDFIRINFIETGREPSTLVWPITNIDYVEQLIYSILEAKEVGPVYRQLFGIRVKNHSNIWLAPNTKISNLLLEDLGTLPGTLELRMRFRPSSYTKLLVLDKRAFEIIFAQMRYDFLYTKFSTSEKKDYILLNESILGLITNDLIIHALENNIDDEEIFKRVKLERFIPLKAAKWQRPLLYHLRNKLNLPKSIQVGLKTSDRNVFKVKQAFIELFLYDVCLDYGTETYRASCIDDPDNPIKMDIRIRYLQTRKDSSCIIEGCFATQESTRQWFELFNIYTVCYATIRQNAIEFDRMNGKLLRVQFRTRHEARSFMSLIDGYYRLMRKWNFNICRDITSPDLEFLRTNKCHGPIGFESMRSKLTKLKKPGSFIIRRCMKINNRFLIDVVLQSEMRLTIDIDWDRVSSTYSMIGHSVKNLQGANVEIYMNQNDYKELHLMIQDLQIRVSGPAELIHPPQQLKYCIPPSELDDCPALLLSISKTKIAEFEKSDRMFADSFRELPRIFPPGMLQPNGKIIHGIPNNMSVRTANLTDGQIVIIKEHSHDCQNTSSTRNDLLLSQASGFQRNMEFFSKLKPAQLRLADWIFVKSPFVAETIGLDLSRNALIQEYLEFGTLDSHLSTRRDINQKEFRMIIYQLASSLMFLQDNRIIHGKIRCHNLHVKCLNPLAIKLTDPLGTFDAHRDRAFIPPELFDEELVVGPDTQGHLQIKDYEFGIDIWAFGTTTWQIYSMGQRPAPGEFANLLTKPRACPDKIWQIIDSCWAMDAASRASPAKIFRDLNDEFAWKIHKNDYEYVSSCRTNDSINSPPGSPSPSTYGHHTCSDIGSFNGTISSNVQSTDCSQSYLLHPRAASIDAARSPHHLPARIQSTAMFLRNLFSYRYAPDSYSTSSPIIGYVKHESTSSRSSTPLDFETTEVNSPDTVIDPSQIQLSSEIGRGNNGVVFKGIWSQRWKCPHDTVVALKLLHTSHEPNGCSQLKQEYEMLRNLNHENIVKTFGLVGHGDSMMLVMEFMPLGSLLTRLKNIRQDDLFTLPLHKYSLDVARGMEYLESVKIVHRDLALRNILVKDCNLVKICDFGLARNCNYGEPYKLQTDQPLPIKWYAPEVLREWNFTHKSDVWSYGVVLWEIYSGGNVPQFSGSYAELWKTLEYERLPIPNGCPMRMYALMMRCWTLDPEDRDSFSKIRGHLETMERENDESAFPTRIIDIQMSAVCAE